MNVNPYLFFDGNCREAFEFYASCLGVEIKAMLTTADMPGGAAAGGEGDAQIMHACIAIGSGFLMASDWNCGGMNTEPYRKPAAHRVSLELDGTAEAERVFKALAEGGSIDAPMEKAFFAERFGMLTDRFGTPWMVLTAENS